MAQRPFSAFFSALTYQNTKRFLAPGFWSLCVVICLNDKGLELMSVNGDSMAPTLSPAYFETGSRDFVLMRKYAPTKDLKRGDVVSFHTPLKPETLGIKRVVALEGDWVDLDWRRRPADIKHDQWDSAVVWDSIGEKREGSMGRRRVRVPLGHVWVEGDNARKSHDSNWYGPVSFATAVGLFTGWAETAQISRSLIQGKAMCVVYPFDRFGATPWESYKSKTRVRKDPHFKLDEWEDLLR